ncbi:Protein-L-isoaspartate O-methyltransferase [Lysobacter dokdonensis DS-58]|uniref:Protein-L-isoaspartate O-methyltransferase n=1 Tax=Lysobacter dokdonensis DS-58 TaxID=1300345 RepID=A0A0A2X3B5_9GAMM|nr:protein-L-isoaspartate(D-aspartate) O-methyltransferase [Lysobacter dokdonensis]KGQ19679.1 Protein-L-isoaspartate O-methyltransferase [Lysobacter dokdonensis DS-58]
MPDFGFQRDSMVRHQIAARGIDDAGLLDAMRTVPRERFVDDSMRDYAYEDGPLPIAAGQTISQPYIVARMIEIARVAPGDRVLEIGAGSGYAAAVMAQIAARVYTIERHAQLTALARGRFDSLHYGNIEVRTGDGTRGWPEVAPFDAILAAAGGPDVPEVLKQQLAIGGRLVMPVGRTLHHQRLVRVIRTGEFRFEQQDFDDVAFVPLIGTYGWAEDGSRPMPTPRDRDDAPVTTLPKKIAKAAEPLPNLDDPAFGALFDRFADARVVLLGEASHGTSEFYRARAAITRRLVEHHGFRIVAAEADWPDMATLDRYVRHRPPRENAEKPFQRFPTWMWRNREFESVVQWLHRFNADRAMGDRAGLFGLDLYSMGASMRAVIDYLDDVDPDAAHAARERYACLTPWTRDPAEYGRMSVRAGHALCEPAVMKTLMALLDKHREYIADDGPGEATEWFDATQNARLVRNAEKYYRTMYEGAAQSWNQRDQHMFDTLQQLLDAGGPQSRAVVWAHNSHIGDARFTEMGMRGEFNLGQLCKKRWGSAASTIGFGTHTGTVAAASDWDAPMQVMSVRPSLADSYEAQCHDSVREGARVLRFLLDLREGVHGPLREALDKPRLERFIGVVYRPETERFSHYAQAVLPAQFDAWVWFDETRAVRPLGADRHATDAVPETYPFGL